MKAFVDFIRNAFTPAPKKLKGKIPIYVRCEHCGEALKTEINLQHDLSAEYGESSRQDRYHTNKTIIGSGICFQRIQVQLEFDATKRIIAETIQGGSRIEKQEYEQLTRSAETN